MKAKITEKSNEEMFEKTIRKELERQRIIGMRIGAKSVSKVIYDKLIDNSKTDAEKIAEIIEFCKVGLKIDED